MSVCHWQRTVWIVFCNRKHVAIHGKSFQGSREMILLLSTQFSGIAIKDYNRVSAVELSWLHSWTKLQLQRTNADAVSRFLSTDESRRTAGPSHFPVLPACKPYRSLSRHFLRCSSEGRLRQGFPLQRGATPPGRGRGHQAPPTAPAWVSKGLRKEQVPG